MAGGIELPLPRTIAAHGWWTVDGEKMSKSQGNVVDPNKEWSNSSASMRSATSCCCAKCRSARARFSEQPWSRASTTLTSPTASATC
ncbi:MAG: class I tRNA ligase family protein [Nitrospiraceae bacterium]